MVGDRRPGNLRHPTMELAFLGTGAAFSLERYNGAVCVDRRLLLDAGAPLLPHLHRLDIDPTGIRVCFLTHFHGDHLAGLIPYLCFRAHAGGGTPLTIIGPAGVEERVDRLLDAAWGSEWASMRSAFPLDFVEAGGGGRVAGIAFETVPLEHGIVPGMGYRLELEGRVLAYAGDTRARPPGRGRRRRDHRGDRSRRGPGPHHLRGSRGARGAAPDHALLPEPRLRWSTPAQRVGLPGGAGMTHLAGPS
jgi:ribonuclease BN (tRNA processing enzyme)